MKYTQLKRKRYTKKELVHDWYLENELSIHSKEAVMNKHLVTPKTAFQVNIYKLLDGYSFRSIKT